MGAESRGWMIWFVTLLAAALSSFAQTERACTSELCRLVDSGRLETLRWPDFLAHRRDIAAFYEPSGYSLAWVRDAKLSSQACTLIDLFRESAKKGLNPDDYDASRWAERIARIPRHFEEAAQLDLAITVALIRYVTDVHFGRANPGLYHDRREMFDMPEFLRTLPQSKDIKAELAAIDPPYDGYRRTEIALRRYMELAKEDAPVVLPVPAKRVVEPGSMYEGTASLVQFLRRVGDLPANEQGLAGAGRYEGPIVDAVKRFQTRHGLDPDGRIGKATLAALQVPLSRRVVQLALTLERWRWVPHAFSRPPIVVNIPEFRLRAYDANYHVEMEMKVVVGKAYTTETPLLSANLSSVVFHPYWNVPLSIQRKELLPKLVKDPHYLADNEYEVIDSRGSVVEADVRDQATLAALRSGRLLIRQIPGKKNALGAIKFSFPNPYDVYMHDTPAGVLFARSRRDFSHGCIRVERPRALAEWVFRDNPQWDKERIERAIREPKTIEVPVSKPIPVLIVYATAVPLDQGEVRFFDDIYGKDAELTAKLSEPHP
jgi:murein L,D-transpeptidase YcbB/YkuD